MLIYHTNHAETQILEISINKHVRPSTSYLSHVVLLFHNMPSTWRIFNPRFRLFCRQSSAEPPCLDFPSIFSSSRRGLSLFFSLIRERSLRPLIHPYLSFLLLLSLSSISPYSNTSSPFRPTSPPLPTRLSAAPFLPRPHFFPCALFENVFAFPIPSRGKKMVYLWRGCTFVFELLSIVSFAHIGVVFL